MRYCQYCGKEVFNKTGTSTCTKCRDLYRKGLSRIRQVIAHEKSKNTSERIEQIKNKYSKGVPNGEIEKWIGELMK